MSQLSGPPAERRIGVFTTDVDLVIKSWDPALEQMTGITAADACGRDLHALVPDLAARVPPQLLREPLVSGSVQVLAPALHKYLIPCPPAEPSAEFDCMQQRVVVGALRNDEGAAGLVVTVEDVTARLERERELARQLREGAPADRVAAIRRLAELDSEGVGPIGHALGDDDWQVRRAAVRALAAKRDAALVDTVIVALRDGHRNFSLLSSALELLSTTGVDVTEALVSLMRHPEADLRIQAALALGMQRRPEAIEALLAAFDDPDVNVRFHAIEAIGKQAHPAAIDRLCEVAASGDFFLAFPAVEALIRVGDPLAASRLAPLLEEPLLAGIVAEALGQIGDEDAVAALVRTLEYDAAPVEPIVVALATIHQRYRMLFDGAVDIEDIVAGAINSRGTERIVAALEWASGDALKHAVTVLSWIRDPSIPPALARLLGSGEARHEVVEALVRCAGPAVDLLVQQLSTDDLETKRDAVVALGRMGDTRATEPLVKLLDDDDERPLWVAVTGALARLGDRRAFDGLLEHLGDADVAVRQGAIGALNSIGHPGMAERIAPMIDDPDRFVRESAVRIAGYFGYSSCADATMARCLDPDESVRAAALEHLPYFEDDRTLAALARALESDTARARAAAARALASMVEPSAQQLLSRALDDSDQWVRYFAAIGLGQQADPERLNRLVTLARTDAAVPVAVAAIDAAAAIGTDDAVAALATIAAQEDDRGIAALTALGKLRSSRITGVLRDALRSSDARRRLAAVGALVSHGTPEAVDVLAWTATADVDLNVGRTAIGGLRDIAGRGEFASGRAVRALVDTLRDPIRRNDALDALARLAASAIPELASALESDEPQLRRGVVEALGRLNHPAASAALLKALADGDAVVRRTAIVGLSRIGTRGLRRRLTALALSDSSPAVRQAAAVALNRRAHAVEGDE
jgi:HEAT repeat protein